MRPFKFIALSFFISAFFNPIAFAIGSSGDEPNHDDIYSRALSHIDAGRYRSAVRDLRTFLSENPNDADAWNWLGFSARNIGRFDLSWDAYDRALAIDPEHLGAMNYLGHLYLTRGDMAGAETMAARLFEACGDCHEYNGLIAAIAAVQ